MGLDERSGTECWLPNFVSSARWNRLHVFGNGDGRIQFLQLKGKGTVLVETDDLDPLSRHSRPSSTAGDSALLAGLLFHVVFLVFLVELLEFLLNCYARLFSVHSGNFPFQAANDAFLLSRDILKYIYKVDQAFFLYSRFPSLPKGNPLKGLMLAPLYNSNSNQGLKSKKM